MMMVTSSVNVPQGPLFIVHLNVLVPTLNPETVVVAEEAFPKVPEPAITVHCPVAGTSGVEPVNVSDEKEP